MTPVGVCILGSTGSIGQNTLAVIALHPEQYKVIALTASTSVDSLFQQCCTFKPRYAVMMHEQSAKILKEKLEAHNLSTTVLSGITGLCEVAALPEVSKVVAAIVGAAGLLPTLGAIKAGKQILLANKEALVMAGDLFLSTAHQSGASLLPVDSEHNALFQCMPPDYQTGHRPIGVERLILTASGGPFLNTELSSFNQISPEMACQHPNWKMGKKITVDCATLMNKGLEVIEASKLFQFNQDEIDVVVHPQSVIHSLVEYTDGSVLAQLGTPDMRIPIAFCLSWPKRISSGAAKLSLSKIKQLTFIEPDTQKFKCLALAYQALALGKAAPTVLNASNEVVVEAFLNAQMCFSKIPSIIERVLEKFYDLSAVSLDDILMADKLAREKTYNLIQTEA
ncbi:MAG: 1-deoxy-D-xylulose-5-phosphate reductoisomerase [Candidatus Berkiella sp.]